MQEITVYVKVISFPQFDQKFYDSLYKKEIFGNISPIDITTIDLAAMFSRMNSDIDSECSADIHQPWRSLTCLGILAKEGLIDLAVWIVNPETYYKTREGTVINLTQTEDPYWIIPHACAGIDTYQNAKEPVIQITHPCLVKFFYAKPVDNALNRLLEKADNDWYKVWYTHYPIPEKKWHPQEKERYFPELPDTVIIVDDRKEVTYNLWTQE